MWTAEDSGWVPSMHRATYNHLYAQLQGLWSALLAPTCTVVTCILIKNIQITNYDSYALPDATTMTSHSIIYSPIKGVKFDFRIGGQIAKYIRSTQWVHVCMCDLLICV